MGATVYPAPLSLSSVPNWQLVSSNSSLSGLATITFSGLTGYSKYRLMAGNVVAVSGTTQLRINADSGTNYNLLVSTVFNPTNAPYSPVVPSLAATGVALGNQAGTAPTFDVQVDNSLILAPKGIVGWGSDVGQTANANNGAQVGIINAVYITTSAITSISIVRTANFTSGTIYLLGAN